MEYLLYFQPFVPLPDYLASLSSVSLNYYHDQGGESQTRFPVDFLVTILQHFNLYNCCNCLSIKLVRVGQNTKVSVGHKLRTAHLEMESYGTVCSNKHGNSVTILN